MNKYYFVFLLFFAFSISRAQNNDSQIFNMKKRSEVIDEILENRIQHILPKIMRREKIDMWVVISREYNEDPIIKTLLPSTWVSARRRTILIMFDKKDGKEIECLAVSRYNVGNTFKSSWDKEKQPNQWERVKEIIEERNPKKIGLNYSKYFALADGITKTDFEEFNNAIGDKLSKRIVSAEKLSVGWLETRSELETKIYPQICRIAHNIIDEAFSEKVITPGVTSTEDVVWWMREKVRELNLTTWFHPTVSIQRADKESFDHLRTFDKQPKNNIIQPGDLIHCDFGITYLKLNTDTQQHAYIFKNNETKLPAYLEKAFKIGNRLQDIFTNNFQEGRTGNEVLKMSREEAINEKISPSIYTHPIGYHGHAAGTTLGMWDSQEGVPYTGDYPLHMNTAYSIELNVTTHIKEWNKDIRIMLEEDAYFDENGVNYIDGRQTKLLTIPRISTTNAKN